jgi:tetratricopeptide (TPR) repeat protein
MKIARDLDPLSPIANTYLGLAYHFVGNQPEAAAQLRKALELDPGFVEARLELGNLSLDRQDFKQFYFELDRAKELAPESRIDLMRATGYAIEGKRTEALQLVHKWEKPPSGVFVRSTSIANVYAILGDKAQMYTWLDRAYADRDGMLAFLKPQGAYRPYRSEPRFIALEKKLGFK